MNRVKNSYCPYCGVEMLHEMNHPRSRSGEHLIPRTMFSAPKMPPDFDTCRECNGKKSKLDNILSVIAKMQSGSTDLGVDALKGGVVRRRDTAPAFIKMIDSAVPSHDHIQMTMPIDGRDLYDYCIYLAKGQYFKKTGLPLDLSARVIQVQPYLSKVIMSSFEASYAATFRTHPVEDLKENPNCEVLGDGECLIWSKGIEYLFIFHRYTVIGLRVPIRTKKSRARAEKLRSKLLRDFPPTSSSSFAG